MSHSYERLSDQPIHMEWGATRLLLAEQNKIQGSLIILKGEIPALCISGLSSGCVARIHGSSGSTLWHLLQCYILSAQTSRSDSSQRRSFACVQWNVNSRRHNQWNIAACAAQNALRQAGTAGGVALWNPRKQGTKCETWYSPVAQRAWHNHARPVLRLATPGWQPPPPSPEWLTARLDVPRPLHADSSVPSHWGPLKGGYLPGTEQ